jgi:hypothetical protein
MGTGTIMITATSTGAIRKSRWVTGPGRLATGPPARQRTGQAATTRVITALPALVPPGARHPVKARAAGHSRRSPGDGPAERSGTWKAVCIDSSGC